MKTDGPVESLEPPFGPVARSIARMGLGGPLLGVEVANRRVTVHADGGGNLWMVDCNLRTGGGGWGPFIGANVLPRLENAGQCGVGKWLVISGELPDASTAKASLSNGEEGLVVLRNGLWCAALPSSGLEGTLIFRNADGEVVQELRVPRRPMTPLYLRVLWFVQRWTYRRRKRIYSYDGWKR